MKVLINALGADTGGGANHLIHFIESLSKTSTTNEYFFLIRDKFSFLNSTDQVKISLQPSHSSKNIFQRFLFDNFSLSHILSKYSADILVSLTNFGPIKTRVPHIVFQQNPLYFSSWYRTIIRRKAKIDVILRAELTHQIMVNSKVVVTPSDSMTEMIKTAFPDLNNVHFRTLYHGFDKNELTESLTLQTKNLLEISKFKILYPTLPAFHKGISVLFDTIRKLQSIWNDQFKIYLTFSETEAINWYDKPKIPTDWKKLCESVVFLGKLPQSQMNSLYKSCDLMFYPSLCESFGFSMLEAIGNGLPIIATDTPINREMCQKSALFFSPESPMTAAEQIKLVLTTPQIKSELLANGVNRFSGFDWSWDRYRTQFEQIISECT